MKTAMKKTVYVSIICLGLGSGMALHAGASPAPQTHDLDKIADLVNHVETAKAGISLSGYVDAGYVYNFIGGDATPNTQGYAADGSAKGDFNLNAVKLVLEKPLTEANEFQAGFRVDVMFGEDANGLSANSAATGSSDSLYVQQGFVNVRVPVGNGLDIQVGRINSILGFEADERPANLNITQGLNAAPDPGPAAGILLTYPLTERVTLLAGVNNGNGQDTNSGLDASSDGYAFNFALGLTNEQGNAETQIAFQGAPWGDGGIGQTENEPLYGLNWWGTWAPRIFNDKVLLAFNTSLWSASHFSGASADTLPGVDDGSTFYTAALYAKYQFTDIFSLAGRAEYTHADDTQILGFGGGDDADIFGWTLTAGFDVLENVLLRTEYRLDLGDDINTNANGHGTHEAHTLAAQVVYSF
jgi:hypothetical protein